MENKNKLYILGLAIYILAAIQGLFIFNGLYWIILLASVVISLLTLNLLTNKDTQDEIKPLKFDWISIFTFTGLQFLFMILIGAFRLPMTGFTSFLNLLTQILAYIALGYVVIRFTLNHVNFYKDMKFFKKDKTTTKEDLKKEVQKETQVEVKRIENKKEPIVEENYSNDESFDQAENDSAEVEVIDNSNETTNQETFKEEEKIETPYMEEER